MKFNLTSVHHKLTPMLPFTTFWPRDAFWDTSKHPSPQEWHSLSPLLNSIPCPVLLDGAIHEELHLPWSAVRGPPHKTVSILFPIVAICPIPSLRSLKAETSASKVWSSRLVFRNSKKIIFEEKSHQYYFYILTLWINKCTLLLNKRFEKLSFVFHYMCNTHSTHTSLYIVIFLTFDPLSLSPLTAPWFFILCVIWGVKESQTGTYLDDT